MAATPIADALAEKMKSQACSAAHYLTTDERAFLETITATPGSKLGRERWNRLRDICDAIDDRKWQGRGIRLKRAADDHGDGTGEE